MCPQGGSSPGSTFETYGSCKTEHNAPDPYGGPRVLQGSTCGYMGIYDLTGITDLLTTTRAANSWFPAKIPSVYTALQGERDITAQIQLGGKGKLSNGNDARYMVDSQSAADAGVGGGKKSFEDIDGLYWVAAAGTNEGYVVIQEDGGNYYGERTFLSKGRPSDPPIERANPQALPLYCATYSASHPSSLACVSCSMLISSPLPLPLSLALSPSYTLVRAVRTDGVPMTYYFIAQSGGRYNTRMKANVGVPAKTNDGNWASSAHEFSGAIDLSGMLAKDASGNFIATAGVGATKRAVERTIPINNKTIAFGLQAHQLTGGIIRAMTGDRGGQIFAYQPNLPAVDA